MYYRHIMICHFVLLCLIKVINKYNVHRPYYLTNSGKLFKIIFHNSIRETIKTTLTLKSIQLLFIEHQHTVNSTESTYIPISKDFQSNQ